MNDDSTRLSEVISSIYDTAFDPALWTKALEQTANFVGGVAATLALHDTASATGNAAYLWGDDPHYTALYYKELARTNPVMVPANLTYEPGDVFSLTQIMPPEEFYRTRIFKEWVEPQGWGDFTHSLIEKSGSRFSHFGVAHAKADSPAGDAPRRRLKLLVPHVMKAVAISKSMELRKLEAATLSTVADAVAAAVFLVNSDSMVVYANQSAQEMLQVGTVLRQVNGILVAAAKLSHGTLREAIAGATADDGASQPAALALDAADCRWMLHVVSLQSGARQQAGRLFGAAAGVFVHRAELIRPTLIQTVTRHFKLTPAESRVLFAIMQAGSVAETASALGVSSETVRTLLKRIYSKTGRRRQADLIKIVAEFANPMVG